MKKAFLPLLLLLAICLPGLSQERLTDASSVRTDQDSNPGRFTASNDQLFFAAATALEGNELWKTHGTPAGTTLVKDIYPGAEGSVSGHPAALGNAVYFFANDGARGVQLWKSDGSTGGTERVTDFLRGRMLGLTLVQDQLFFLVETAEYNWEVWKTNGTAAGTEPVKKNISGWNSPQNCIAAGNLFYFALQPAGSNDPDLWRSDGTEAGTVLAADINPGAGHANPTGMVNLGKDILFIADTDAHGRQLWHVSPAVTAVEDPLVAAAVAAYPNPTNGEVTLRLAAAHFTGPVTISTLDLAGKVLQSETFRTMAGLQPTVNLWSLPPGLYLLRITGVKGTVTKKIIKR